MTTKSFYLKPHACLLHFSHVAERLDKRQRYKSFSFLLTGLLLILSSTLWRNNQRFVFGFLLVCGIILTFYGIFCFIKIVHQIIYLPTGSTIRHTQIFYDYVALPLLKRIVETGKVGEHCEWAAPNGEEVCVDMYSSDDHHFVAVQLNDCTKGKEKNVTSFICYTGEDANRVLHLLNS